jgi:hypothetical protein
LAPRNTLEEKEAFEERLAICMADGMSYAEALVIADKQLWDTIRRTSESESLQKLTPKWQNHLER